MKYKNKIKNLLRIAFLALPLWGGVGGGLLLLLGGVGLLSSCRTDDPIIYSTTYDTGGGTQPSGDITGMYVLCEGNMGSNKCTLDYLDMTTAQYHRNIYSERNPETVKELGDVGNDIKVYGSRLWMVINCSNKVEVANVKTAKRIGQVNIPNCRYLAFHDGYAYVSSFAGPVMGGDMQLGLVYKVDTLSLEIVGSVEVGYQPEEMAILDGYLYVANSGGYMPPTYDNRVSVINLHTFKVERSIDVGLNLHRCRADRYGQLWVTSRGNYEDVPAKVYCLQQSSDGYAAVGDEIQASISDMCIVGDSLYYIGTAWSEIEQRNTVSYGIINVRTHQVVADYLSTSQEISKIRMPYGIIVNPYTKDFYVMDAKNYVSSGELFHFKSDGTFDWSVRTGDIPAHAVFVGSEMAFDDNTAPQTASPYIQAVDEYVPAPGQFVNTLPEATVDDTPETMATKCTQALAANAKGMVTLGGYGGYITFHFDHPVVNRQGQYDLAIYGNAYEGNSEPGIVMVSQDVNGNGKPDDPWYELSGSADTDSVGKVIYNYEITYTRQEMQNIPWTDNRGQTGYIPRNSYHTQEYFPLWLPSPLTLGGTLLPRNGHQSTDNLWTLDRLRYGYVDNTPNSDSEGCCFNIDWAVDSNRRPVNLSHIDFVRVYNAQNQICGWLGETSTEITGAVDLGVVSDK